MKGAQGGLQTESRRFWESPERHTELTQTPRATSQSSAVNRPTEPRAEPRQVSGTALCPFLRQPGKALLSQNVGT